MAGTATTTAKPIWIDLMSADAEGSRRFYGELLGWTAEVNPDPQFGGYSVAQLKGRDVAGIGPLMGNGPTAWTVYVGTNDANETARKVQAAGGSVIAPPMDVGPQGRMAIFQDPSGAVFGVWQPGEMAGFGVEGEPDSFGWAELSAKGLDKAIPFYEQVFGWGQKTTPMGNSGSYTEFQLDGHSVAGSMDVTGIVPDQVPSYWGIYFTVADLDAAFAKATALGAVEMMAPQEYPGGRFAIVRDPQGAVFGMLG